MITTRGWWFILGAILLVLLGVFCALTPLLVAGLALVLWFAVEGLLVAICAHFLVRRLDLTHSVENEYGPVSVLFTGQTFQVHITGKLRGWFSLPYLLLRERIPLGAEFLDGETEYAGPVRAKQAFELRYSFRPSGAGCLRFEGFKISLVDLQGFFYREIFLSSVLTVQVLPVPIHAGGRSGMTKKHNQLLPPGIHRWPRTGSASELLDLRDYRPGDPPKTIAWKISARRGRLITKEFEGEVPLRCTLFVDNSSSVRVGPTGQNALARLIAIAAAVAQANTSIRDLTGLCLLGDREVQAIRPARSARHLAHMLHALAAAAAPKPSSGQADLSQLISLAYAFAQEIYPSWIHSDINGTPFWWPWLWPVPTYSQTSSGSVQRGALKRQHRLLRSLVHPLVLLRDSFAQMTTTLERRLSLLLSGRQRTLAKRRKALAALLSVRYGLAPRGLAVLLEDDALMTQYLQQFLAEHQVPYQLHFYDRQGQYQFAASEKVQMLSKVLSQAVARGHDNELFVLLVDLLELTDHLEPLLCAVRVAQARHHQVLIVCPWPPGIPLPEKTTDETPHSVPINELRADDEQLALHQVAIIRFHRAFYRLRRIFARLGVPCHCAANNDSVTLILDRLERLRLPRRRR